MATSINNISTKGVINSPINQPIMPTAPPDKEDLDITKHIQDVKGITNMHIHTVGHNNHAIEFVGNKDHHNHTQWPLTKEMTDFISDNNNLNKKYLPIVIPYSAACYVCKEDKNKSIKKISIIAVVAIIILFAIIIIIIFINKNTNTKLKINSIDNTHKPPPPK
jgi:hypothetical protein